MGLSLTLVFLGLEFGGFLGGCSMFNGTASLLCILFNVQLIGFRTSNTESSLQAISSKIN